MRTVRRTLALAVALLGLLAADGLASSSIAVGIPRGIRDWGYDLVAKHRHTLISDPACLLPTPAERARFLP